MAQRYTEEDLQQALREVKSGVSQNRASSKHGVPRQTLQYRLRQGNSSMGVAKEKNQRLPHDRETQVLYWALSLAGRGQPPTHPEIMDHVSCILEKEGDYRPLGKNWISSFIRRHPLVKVIKYKKSNRRQKVITPKLGRETSDDGQVTTPMDKSTINNRGDITPPRKPEMHQKESTPNREAEAPGDDQLETPVEINECSLSIIVPSAFWEPTRPSLDSLESFKRALKTRVKGLPRQIPGVRLLTRSELLSRGKSPPLAIVHTETDNRGVRVPSTQHIDSTFSASIHRGEGVVDNMLAEEQDARSRMKDDPGNTGLGWDECQNMRIYLIEQASDSNGSPKWVFWKSRNADGRITGDQKPNSTIKTQRLGHIIGRSWFYCPSAPVLNLKSAFFIYNQIKFRDVEPDENSDILPVIFVTAYAGPNPEKMWKRYISSYNGQAHIQFHARYVTPNPPSTITQRIRLEHGDGFGFRRDLYTLCGMNGSSSSLLEGRISIAIRTTTDIPQPIYSAVTLAESDTFQNTAPGEAWDKTFRPLDCGRFTGIAVFQSMLRRAIQFCNDENTKTIESIPPRSSWLDETSKEQTEKLMNSVCEILDQTTRGIKKLAKDCQATTQRIVELAEDNETATCNVVIEKRWNRLIRFQQEIHEKLASMLLDIYDED